jgi:predicted nucleotidyltransferase
MLDKNQVLAKITPYFKDKPAVVAVYLFGSLVKNRQNKQSDIDLAILFHSELSILHKFNERLTIAGDLEDLLDTAVDVVDLDQATPYFFHQMMLAKELIVDCAPSVRVTFEVQRRKHFFDMMPFYKMYHGEALRRLEGAI